MTTESAFNPIFWTLLAVMLSTLVRITRAERSQLTESSVCTWAVVGDPVTVVSPPSVSPSANGRPAVFCAPPAPRLQADSAIAAMTSAASGAWVGW